MRSENQRLLECMWKICQNWSWQNNLSRLVAIIVICHPNIRNWKSSGRSDGWTVKSFKVRQNNWPKRFSNRQHLTKTQRRDWKTGTLKRSVHSKQSKNPANISTGFAQEAWSKKGHRRLETLGSVSQRAGSENEVTYNRNNKLWKLQVLLHCVTKQNWRRKWGTRRLNTRGECKCTLGWSRNATRKWHGPDLND